MPSKYFKLLPLLLVATVFLFVGCSDDDNGTNSTGTAPSVPTGLNLTVGQGQITISWSASTGGNLQGYNVYRSDDGSTYTKINDTLVTGLQYIDDTVDDGTDYYYRVSAVGDLESDLSQAVTATTLPSVPANLSAQGSLGQIVLTWDASTGANIQGYEIWRSTTGAIYVKLSDSIITGLTYTDTDVNDGYYYHYKIRAIADENSEMSSYVRQMHGTRLVSEYGSGLIVSAGAGNPYVIEDTVTINDGDLTIANGASLYMLDNSVLDMEVVDVSDYSYIGVDGLFRVVAADSTPALITAHKRGGGALVDEEGTALRFTDNCVDYDTDYGTGTLIKNCTITNLRYSNDAIRVFSCSPRLYNCKIYSNKETGGSYFEVETGSAPIVEHCALYRIVLTIQADLQGTDAVIEKNLFRNGYYTIYFSGDGMVEAGQVVNNDFDGTTHGIYLFNMTAVDNVPLENNYWNGGTPTIIQTGTSITADMDPALGSPPADCGPTW